LKFVFFSREETGQNGSTAYLESVDKNKQEIIAAINLDMIAYGGDEEDIDLVTRPEHQWIVHYVSELAKIYEFNTKKVIRRNCF
jgi:Zn-dependent M28 family amino/carboxypeptidase